MGWETLAIAGFTALSAGSQMANGEDQAKAATEQGRRDAINSANDTARSAGTLRTSFLQSGLTLEGGPMAALRQVFDTGNTNISRIAENANNRADNAINTARTAALTTLARGASGALAANSTFFGTPASVNGLGQDAGSWFDSSPMGPHVSPFSSQFYTARF